MVIKPISAIYIQRGGLRYDGRINGLVTVTARLLTFLSQLNVGDWEMDHDRVEALYTYVEKVDT